MLVECKNCENKYEGKFCNLCGQNATTHRINLHFLWHDIQHGILHFDSGYFYTLLQLFKAPGQTTKKYLEGKRVRHAKPLSLVIIIAGIYGFLYHFFNIKIMNVDVKITSTDAAIQSLKQQELAVFMAKANEWAGNHYAIIALVQIPVFALFSYVFFKKIGYNYIEHLVINAFATAQKLCIHILLFPLLYLFNNTIYLKPFGFFLNFLGLVYYCFLFFYLTKNGNKIGVIIKSVIIHLLVIILFAMCLFLFFFVKN